MVLDQEINATQATYLNLIRDAKGPSGRINPRTIEDGASVIFKGFKLDPDIDGHGTYREEDLLEDIFTFNGNLPTRNEAIQGVRLDFKWDGYDMKTFSGMIFVLFASSNLARAAVSMWHMKRPYGPRSFIKAEQSSIRMDTSNGNSNQPGAPRFGPDVWNFQEHFYLKNKQRIHR